MATTQEIHKMFDDAKIAGEWFEYECRWQDADCVRNTEMEYCTLISQEEADVAMDICKENFFEIVHTDDTEFSPHYAYFYDSQNDAYYAVRKFEWGVSQQ